MTSAQQPRHVSVFCGGEYREFGDLTAAQVAARADELKAASGLGHGGRVAAVAMGWRELARVMRDREASTVGDLDDETVATYSERLWIVPPGGSLL